MWLWWDFTFDERIIASIGMARIITRMLLGCRGIRQARRAFRSNAKRFVGLISSDEDVSSLVNSADDLIRVPGGTYEDLCLLSKCHYLIGPPSTFSGWASFIGRVPLLYMTNPDMEAIQDFFRVVNW